MWAKVSKPWLGGAVTALLATILVIVATATADLARFSTSLPTDGIPLETTVEMGLCAAHHAPRTTRSSGDVSLLLTAPHHLHCCQVRSVDAFQAIMTSPPLAALVTIYLPMPSAYFVAVSWHSLQQRWWL